MIYTINYYKAQNETLFNEWQEAIDTIKSYDGMLTESVLSSKLKIYSDKLINNIRKMFTNIRNKFITMIKKNHVNERIMRIEEFLRNCPEARKRIIIDKNKKYATTIGSLFEKLKFQMVDYDGIIKRKFKRFSDAVITITTNATKEEEEKLKEVIEITNELYTSGPNEEDIEYARKLTAVESKLFNEDKAKRDAKKYVISNQSINKIDFKDDINVVWKDNKIANLTINGQKVFLYTASTDMPIVKYLLFKDRKIPTPIYYPYMAVEANARGYNIIFMRESLYNELTKEEIIAMLYHEIGHLVATGNKYNVVFRNQTLLHKELEKERETYYGLLRKHFLDGLVRRGMVDGNGKPSEEFALDVTHGHLNIDEIEADFRGCLNGCGYKNALRTLDTTDAKIDIMDDPWGHDETEVRKYVIIKMHEEGFF